MPADQLPEDSKTKEHRQQKTKRPGRKPHLRPGDAAYGTYISSRNLVHGGIGRVVLSVQPKTDDGNPSYWVEPMQRRGGLPFYEIYSQDEIEKEDLVRSPYSGSLETQQRENKDRPRRPARSSTLHYWMGNLPPMPPINQGADRQPLLGSEHSGGYFAPDGQWFAGVDTVTAVGFFKHLPGWQSWYVYVEPTGKTGGNYDFFHSVTREWMDELPSNPIPGVECGVRQRKT
ncbi:hypothetical protein BDW74DRAFT_147959 [Aspergillus multicolor]|uniref:uncharacterized protein n=1 Tax=Aspergillus multicolor TaxID=41759 RepID=UPI003CCD86EB